MWITKHLKNAGLTLTGVTLHFLVFAQNPMYFNKQHNLHSAGETGYSVVQVGNSYYTCGTGTDVLTEYKIGLSLIDSVGNLVWTKSYGRPNTFYYSGNSASLVRTNDGGFALGGTLQDSISTQALLMKFDMNGDTLWTRIFGNDSICCSYQCKQTSDHGYVLVGWTDSSEYWGDVLLIKTDSLGNEEWRKTYGTNNIELGISVTQTSDNGYLIGGEYRVVGGAENEYVIKTDSVGNFQWQRYYGGMYDDGDAFVIQLSDGNYAIGGSLTFSQPGGPGIGDPWGKANIVKIDPNGTTIWNKSYGGVTFNTTITSLTELSDGSIAATGFFGGMNNMEGFLLKTNSIGDSLLLRSYNFYFTNDDYFYDIKATNDNGFVLCGATLGSEFNTWLVKTDSLGCDTIGCNMVGIEPTLTNPASEFNLFPNPSNGTFCIEGDFPEGSEIHFYNSIGEEVIEPINVKKGRYSVPIFLDLPNGLYFLVITSEGGTIIGNRFVITK